MSKPSKKKQVKKKQHEREDRKKLLARRKKIREEAKEDKRRRKLEKDTEIKMKPYRKDAYRGPARTPEEVALQIEENLKVLEQLEDEYEREMTEREGLNQALEQEGFKSIREKMDYLNKKAMEQVEAAQKKTKKKRVSAKEKALKKEQKQQEKDEAEA